MTPVNAIAITVALQKLASRRCLVCALAFKQQSDSHEYGESICVRLTDKRDVCFRCLQPNHDYTKCTAQFPLGGQCNKCGIPPLVQGTVFHEKGSKANPTLGRGCKGALPKIREFLLSIYLIPTRLEELKKILPSDVTCLKQYIVFLNSWWIPNTIPNSMWLLGALIRKGYISIPQAQHFGDGGMK